MYALTVPLHLRIYTAMNALLRPFYMMRFACLIVPSKLFKLIILMAPSNASTVIIQLVNVPLILQAIVFHA
jgi:hypothetical protein